MTDPGLTRPSSPACFRAGAVDLSAVKRTTLEWTAHPARERVGAAVGAVVVILAVAVCVYVFSFRSYGWGLVAIVVQVLALNRFFFPSRFVIDKEGISAQYLMGRQRCTWDRIRRFHYDRRGVYLSTRAHRSRWDAFRGMHVLFGTAREEVIGLIRGYVSASDGHVVSDSAAQTGEEAGAAK